MSARRENLHRNNAAEWAMLVVLYPFAWIAGRVNRIWRRGR
jgi:hypothetical protein